MRLTNGWRYLYKERDRFNFELRIGVLTVFRLYLDISDRSFELTICNYTVEV